jgi:adenylosuccinate synthase
MEEEFFEAIEDLKKLTFIDSEEYLNQALKEGKSILVKVLKVRY